MQTINTIMRTLQEVRSLRLLKGGWSQGYEIPPTENTVNFACDFISDLKNIDCNINIFPGDINAILVTLYKNDDFLDIELSENNITYYQYEKGIGNNYQIIDEREQPSIADVSNMIFKIFGRIICSVYPNTNIFMMYVSENHHISQYINSYSAITNTTLQCIY